MLSNLMMGTLLFGDLWVCCSYLEVNPLVTYGKHMMLLTLKEHGVFKLAVQGTQCSAHLQSVVRISRFPCVSPQKGTLLGSGVPQPLGV